MAERNGRYLVALRRPGTSIGEKWEFPGGKVNGEESPEDALKREFFEEFTVNITVDLRFCTGNFSNKGTDYRLQAYWVHILSDSFFLKEHQSVKWCTLRELEALPMAESDRIIVRCLERMKTDVKPGSAPAE